MTGNRWNDNGPEPWEDLDGAGPAVRDPAGSAQLEDLDGWLAELRTDALGAERSRRQMLVRAAAEEGTFSGLVTDLAERQEPVVVDLPGDRSVRGSIRLVGSDVVVLRDGRTESIVALAKVASIRLRPDGRPSTRRAGPPPLAPRPDPVDRPGRSGRPVDLARVLATLAELEPMVTVHRWGVRSPVSGELAGVGRDLIVIRSSQGGVSYVALSSLVDVSVTGSG